MELFKTKEVMSCVQYLELMSVKTSSEVAILVNGEKVHGYTILNDGHLDFNSLLGDLKTVHNPEIIFETTGFYSRRLQAFLEEYSYAYTWLNPLEAKKQLDGL